MNVVKRLLKPVLTGLGYDVRKVSHIGLDVINDIKAIYRPAKPRVIFDVGAHRGETAVVFSRNFPGSQIHSFEPSAETFSALQSHVSRLENVRTVNVALGRSAGTGTLNINKSTATNSLLGSARVEDDELAELMEPVTATTVAVKTLDEYCAGAGIEVIDVLKMDVQGFEIEVLAGGRRLLSEAHIPLVYCEVSFKPLYKNQPLFEDVYRELVQSGFELVDLYGHVRSQLGSIQWCDALLVHPAALAKRLKEFVLDAQMLLQPRRCFTL